MAKLSEIVGEHRPKQISQDYVVKFGDNHDGVIEFPALTRDGGVVEVGYFYGDIKPKNIIDISSQIGCPSGCKFCVIGNEKFVRNLTPEEMYGQAILMLQLARGFGIDIDAIKHKINIAKTGEPLLNNQIAEGIERLAEMPVSFKVSTVFPNNPLTKANYRKIAEFASHYSDSFQMQISLISTSEDYRQKQTRINLLTFGELAKAGELWHQLNPGGRKVNLSLILAEETPCEVRDIQDIFSPDLFRFRFRPYVSTQHGISGGLTQLTQEKLEQIKRDFQEKGHEVGEWATPTPTEMKFDLAANVTRKRYLDMKRSSQ